jgi:hypothetical protein
MEDYLALVQAKIETLYGISRLIKDTPLNPNTVDNHCEFRVRYINTLRSIGKVLTLCQEDINYQSDRINRHIAELKTVKM